jgi:hypothetical protein
LAARAAAAARDERDGALIFVVAVLCFLAA